MYHKKHTLLYDGGCVFCKKWALRMKKLTGEYISYEPHQEAAKKFSQGSRKRYSQEVQLITREGKIYSGVCAIFKALSLSGRLSWLFKLYEKSFLFRKISEIFYLWIAERKKAFGFSLLSKRLFFLGAGFFLSFLILLILVKSNKFLNFEESFFEYIVSERSERLNEFFSFVTLLGGSDFIYPIATTFLFLIFISRKFDLALLLFSNLVIGGFLYRIFKFIAGRSRPDESFFLVSADGFSFPSGHTTSAVLFFGILVFILTSFTERRLVIYFSYLFFGLVVFLIGFSRIYLGVHWPLDVLGGWIFGFSMTFILISFWYYLGKGKKVV